jgi:hypothetical protein
MPFLEHSGTSITAMHCAIAYECGYEAVFTANVGTVSPRLDPSTSIA